MQYVSSPIHTYCIGQACSMGSLLLAAGEKGKRHALPHSSIMIHRELLVYCRLTCINPLLTEPSGGASGQASDIAIHAKEILRVREVLTGIYQKHCAREGEAVQEGLNRFRPFSIIHPSDCGSSTSFSTRDRIGTGLLHDR